MNLPKVRFDEIPVKLQGGYTTVTVHSLTELVNWKSHKRMKVFYEKGFKCAYPGCNRVGKHLLTVREINGEQKAKHINIFAQDWSLMTVDHIYPQWAGGTWDIDNLQPMCMAHNTKKGGKCDKVHPSELEKQQKKADAEKAKLEQQT